MDKQELITRVRRYITLLSSLKEPPFQLIEDGHYLVGLIQTANDEELAEMNEVWAKMMPMDMHSRAYIEGLETV